MDIESLTIKEAREIASLFQATPSSSQNPYRIGKNYFIRTVTHHFTGRLVEVHAQELVLEDVAWIADDGRFSDAVSAGTFSEVEPCPEGRVILGRGSVIDAHEISFPLPRRQK